ncbi:YgjV family protein [Phocoenobacter skyensis]|uniref:Inner membrane protein n=1 Tax=Phocoenobacter skyensis TaxID=97481 RepID=A0A1H8AB21_9PAST|nr:YgjV family protein [Pasteurella skyensis]MDP8079760.1 YgjV family protein [Pasteurella skyensis]MDP8085665.1 YgjV family protein [Pasteurella skyensis]MDP8162087.1 YgjV family protein [Pasteurella skyensis]MDP8170066.1 YgjV family protein [Pasteurella skyensis]MDP8172946.1 YgjV family protein [Pasteurella skyensis]
MDYIEILGYVAMVTVSCSFLLKDVIKLRFVNAIGCTLFVIYGLLLKSYPVAGLNIFVACINSYYIIKAFKAKT